jgi:hypothetical protein
MPLRWSIVRLYGAENNVPQRLKPVSVMGFIVWAEAQAYLRAKCDCESATFPLLQWLNEHSRYP